MLRIKNILMISVVLLCASVTVGQANPLGGQIPEIPAFLPYASDVPMTKKLPVDGEWMINNIRKRIRIEGGRAYAVDSWLHLFVLKVQPLMVVQKNWRRTGKGRYTGEDLPLLGPFTATLDASGNMQMNVQGKLGPVNLTLSPVRLDSQRRFDQEIGGSGGSDDYSDDEEEYYEDDEEYSEDEGEYYEDDEEYIEDEDEYYEEEEYYEDDEDDAEYYEDGEEYTEDDEYYEDEEEYEEEEPRKVAAKKHSRAKKGCKGKQIYLSGGKCYECPKGYRRVSPTRKMTHPEACTKRGFGTDKRKAKYRWEANGCRKGLFKHKGYCKSCPDGTKRMHVAGLDSGYCKVL